MKTKTKKGFTLIELMIIVAVIGILASIILVAWGISAKDKAAISGYKTSMDSVRAAVEMCVGSGASALDGIPGGLICNPDNNTKYPTFSPQCGDISQFFVNGGESDWAVTTNTGCKDCRLICTVTGCEEAPGTNCD